MSGKTTGESNENGLCFLPRASVRHLDHGGSDRWITRYI
jgi:hypothetical protein